MANETFEVMLFGFVQLTLLPEPFAPFPAILGPVALLIEPMAIPQFVRP